MALTYCRECGGEVSSEAVVCPHCGVDRPVRDAEVRLQDREADLREREAQLREDEMRARGRDDAVLARDGRVVEREVVREPIVTRRAGPGRAIAILLVLIALALLAAWYLGYLDF